ncbi:DoxX family protein [Mycolicibacterium sp.]|uniref:DoxX family protein n=1 Tax=Mycolicibacterium sp. TaxID=2320850 RepID=UPI0028AC6CB5|nr:DoxX family protein [Mycolicibacterium sp.]
MSAHWVSNILQVITGLGLLNVWLVRARSTTAYRGGAAKSLQDEFAVYGLPGWTFYLVGGLKIVCGALLIAGIWYPGLVRVPAAVVTLLMVGALAMHAKVKDPATKFLPALSVLLMCVAILLLN